MTTLEFWPDYGLGPLWTNNGKPVDVRGLRISEDLARRLIDWNGRYEEAVADA